MIRKMKKGLALFMALMVLCTLITVPAFAADESDQETATVVSRTVSPEYTESNGYIYKITVKYLNPSGSTLYLREYLSEYFYFCDSDGNLLNDASATYDGRAFTTSDYTTSDGKEGKYISFEVPASKSKEMVTYYVRPIDGFLGGVNVQAWDNKKSGLYDAKGSQIYSDSVNDELNDYIGEVMVRNDGVEVNNLYALPGTTLEQSRIQDMISIKFMGSGKNDYANVYFTVYEKESMVEIGNFKINKGQSYSKNSNIEWNWNEDYDFKQKLTADKEYYVEVRYEASEDGNNDAIINFSPVVYVVTPVFTVYSKDKDCNSNENVALEKQFVEIEQGITQKDENGKDKEIYWVASDGSEFTEGSELIEGFVKEPEVSTFVYGVYNNKTGAGQLDSSCKNYTTGTSTAYLHVSEAYYTISGVEGTFPVSVKDGTLENLNSADVDSAVENPRNYFELKIKSAVVYYPGTDDFTYDEESDEYAGPEAEDYDATTPITTNGYLVKIDPNGGSWETTPSYFNGVKPQDDGSYVMPLTNDITLDDPEKENATFVGWDVEYYKEPYTDDIVYCLTAKYVNKKAVINYPGTDDFTYDSDKDEYKGPEPEYYDTTTPIEVDGYLVKIDPNGGSWETTPSYFNGVKPQDDGSYVMPLTNDITLDDPEKENATFVGWDVEYYKEPYTGNIIYSLTAKYVTKVPEKLESGDHFAYVIGYPDSSVQPEGTITRAEVATIFFRLLKDEVRDSNLKYTNSFKDVNKGDWFNTAISTMAGLGIINGRDGQKFDPNANITRAEFAAICARFDTSTYSGTVDAFDDISGHWAKDYINKAANLGWVNGYETGNNKTLFQPDKYITRAEAMTLINRVLNRNPETYADLYEGMSTWTDNKDTSAWYYCAVQEATNSHVYERKDNGHEKWTGLKANRDWSSYEN